MLRQEKTLTIANIHNYGDKTPNTHSKKITKIDFSNCDLQPLFKGLRLITDQNPICSDKFYLPVMVNIDGESFPYKMTMDVTLEKSGKNWYLDIILSGFDGEIASILVSNNASEWDIHHRLVNEDYRGQGIASGLLQIAENLIQQFADFKQVEQLLKVNTGQLDVLQFFQKNGFVAMDDELGLNETIEKLQQGNGELTIAECPAEIGRYYYIFKTKILEALGDDIWDENLDPRESNYMRYGERFTLKKHLTPSRNIH